MTPLYGQLMVFCLGDMPSLCFGVIIYAGKCSIFNDFSTLSVLSCVG